MIPVSLEPRPWSRRRWWGFLGLVFGLQVALIFCLSDKSVNRLRPATAVAPRLHLVENASAEVLALNNPTLFALPHPQGFSGHAWLNVQLQKFQSFNWDEPAQLLPLPIQELGSAFTAIFKTTNSDSIQLSLMPEPALMPPEIPPPTITQDRSVVRITGSLAQRRLLRPL